MALQTKILAQLVEDDGTATVEIDYDDVQLRLEAVRVINGGTRPLHVDAIRTSDRRLYQADFPAGTTTELAIPKNGADRFGISVDARGRIDGAEWALRWVVA